MSVAPKETERGTVLLTTLLIMTIMAAITVALMDDIQLSVKRTLNVQAYAQADWQAVGAEDFVTAYLKTDFVALAPEAKTALLQSRTPLVLPTPDGVITLTLKDASHCFNLNSVVTETGGENDTAKLELGQLGELLGLPQNQATVLTSALIDWQDADQQQSTGGAEDGTYLRKNPPYRTADTAMRGPEELRALHGMDEDLWELYRPYVCTGGAGVMPKVNVNSISVERTFILAAALSGVVSGSDAAPVAQSLLRDRPLTGYSSAQQIDQVLDTSGVQGLSRDRISIDVSSIFVEVVTEVGPAERVRTYRFDGVDTDTPRLTYRGWGRETFRLEIETETEQNSENEVDTR
ncbi:MAG: type II secretion system minor pseudopilin GspK [Litorimonas sp.]